MCVRACVSARAVSAPLFIRIVLALTQEHTHTHIHTHAPNSVSVHFCIAQTGPCTHTKHTHIHTKHTHTPYSMRVHLCIAHRAGPRIHTVPEAGEDVDEVRRTDDAAYTRNGGIPDRRGGNVLQSRV